MSAEDAAREALEAEETAKAAVAAEGQGVEGTKTYSEDYVKALRQEAAEYRVKAKQFEQPWHDVADDDRKVWEDIIATTNRDPKAGAEMMRSIARHLSGEAAAEAAASQVQGVATPPALTTAQIQKMVEDRVQQATLQQTIGQINAEAEGMGYKVGTQDYMDLLWVAEHEADADLKKADEMIQERRQGWVDKFLKEKTEGGGREWPRTVRGGSAPATNVKTPTNFKEAKAAMLARFDAF